MAIDKVFYNQSSASNLGWNPTWFGEKYFDDDLVKAIRKWQKDYGIVADGLCGPGTYRRIWTERQADIDDYKPFGGKSKETSHIVHNGNFIPINWPRVVLWSEEDGLKANKGTYYDYSGREDRKPTFFVNHWDVCLSAESCERVLNNRGISVHFCIDNDGTIYQLLDTQHGAWHAGGGKWNHSSVGVEISNAYSLKYQDWYVKNVGIERPIWEGKTVHGKSMKPFLGFYDVQMEAASALWQAMNVGLGMPLECPTDADGYMIKGVSKEVSSNRFEGIVHHYHLTARKIDCAGFDLNDHLQVLKSKIGECGL